MKGKVVVASGQSAGRAEQVKAADSKVAAALQKIRAIAGSINRQSPGNVAGIYWLSGLLASGTSWAIWH